MKAFIGVDPGKNGGIALLNGAEERVWKMPQTERDLFDLLFLIKSGNPECFALLEFVRSSPQMGVVSAFSFGQGYGALRMALTGCGIPFEEIRPQKWQQALGCLSGGDKNRTKSKAQALFPKLKLTHSTSDAILICRYAQMQNL